MINPEEMAKLADPDFLANYLAGLPQPGPGHGGHPAVSVREDSYKGHRIVIKTTYEMTVDGKPLPIHVSLSNDGSAHVHGLPNYQFLSVVDLVRALIEFFPNEFPAEGPPADEYGGHGEPGGHGTHNAGGS